MAETPQGMKELDLGVSVIVTFSMWTWYGYIGCGHG